ncbi:MAG: metal-dependent transcriptional regulator [Sphingobacteriaceae bacterium]
MLISVTEENYIKAIYALTHSAGVEHANTNQLSLRLNNKAASVSDMLQRLFEKKLIDYKKYHGVKLTKKGLSTAIQIVRKHRLWEVFLVEKLNFKWDEVHEIAEQLEHVHSEELVKRLDKFLNYPKYDPHGDPIPDMKGIVHEIKQIELDKCKIKNKVIFSGVKSHTKEFLQHISKLGLSLGYKIELINRSEFDDLLEIKIGSSKKTIHIGHKTAENILVEVL